MNEEPEKLKSELESKELELRQLRSQLAETQKKSEDLEDLRRAMLYMLEDLNRSTEAVTRSQREWLRTVDAFPDPLFVHDADYLIVRANKAYADAAGLPFKEFIGRCYFEVFPKMDGPFSSCTEAIEKQKEAEEIFRSPSGRSYRTRFFPFTGKGDGFRYSTHIMEDVTEAEAAKEKIKQEMDITSDLLMIAEAISGKTDMGKLMEEVVACSQRLMKSAICLSYIFDQDANIFSPSQAAGLSREEAPLFRTGPLAKDVWFVKEAIVLKRACSISAPLERRGLEGEYSTSDALKWIEGLTDALVIPLVGRSGPVGMLLAIYRYKKVFTERDYTIAGGMSRQIATALEEARLYRDSVNTALDLSHKIETIRIMHEIDKSILSVLDRNELLETVVGLPPGEAWNIAVQTQFISRALGPMARLVYGDESLSERGKSFGLRVLPDDPAMNVHAVVVNAVPD